MLATLIDRAEGEELPLPAGLRQRYGGPLRMPAGQPRVFANFVSTIDGVVSFGIKGEDRARHVSRGDPGDRFMLGLLRAVADAVVVGAGTLRKEPDSVWIAEAAFPDASADFARLRSALQLPERPLTVLVSASGDLDVTLPAFARGGRVVVATTEAGAARLRRASPGVAATALTGQPDLKMADVVRLAIAESGGQRILTEGGPRIFGQFLEERALDELFLTVAPRIAGRTREAPRVGLVEGAAFASDAAPGARLVSLKAGGDYLFTRYAFART